MRRPVQRALALAVICLPLYGFELYSKLKNEEGNRYYKKGRLGKAKVAYEKALSASPESDEIAFNLGNTYYREGSFAESLKKFKNAAEETAPPGLQARAFYNSGNALYRQEDLTKAAEFYKQALRIDPKDQDAKYNLELVERALRKKKDEPQRKDKKDQEKKEDQEQDSFESAQDEKPKDGQEKKPEPDQGKGGQKDQKQDQGQGEPKEGDQKKDSFDSAQDEKPKDGQDKEGGQEPKEKPKSDAEARAEQILAALESGEQQTMKMQGAQNGPGPKVRRITEKDW